MMTNNTLILGNGFSRSIFKNMPSWASLFDDSKSNISNYTILYEVNLLKCNMMDDFMAKKALISKIKEALSLENIKNDTICNLDKFGKYLAENNVHDIITTNYDNGIELILCEICGYKKIDPEDLVEEKIYNIRTYKKFLNKKNNHQIKLWKIHGDVDRIKSITLGFDHYCGYLSKLSEYIKGNYKSDQGPECNVKMIEKCQKQCFDNLSWAELFFNTDIYIVGFGMDFSEIDIWWLLNKHARFKHDVPEIQNHIYYLYDNKYDKINNKNNIFETLKAFQVECRGINSNKNYINNIFSEMNVK